MIEKMSQSSVTLLVVKASGLLTHADYTKVFIPQLEACINANGKARALLIIDDDFKGWELEAAWDDAKFGMTHRNDFIKLAVVGGPDWVTWCTNVGELIMGGEVSTYPAEDLSAALEWVNN